MVPPLKQGDLKMNLVPFSYSGQEVRVMTDEFGNPWWVAKDVCDILEIVNTSQAMAGLDEDEKGISKGYTLGGEQDVSTVSESGLYTLILRSNKPGAKPFRKWVTSEVLPSIRKTGSYSVQKSPEHLKISNCFEDMTRLAKMFGLQGNQALLAASSGTKKLVGAAPMELLNLTHLNSPTTSKDLTPTAIGELISLSNRQVNRLLTSRNYQTPLRSGKSVTYMPTDKGKLFVVFKDTNKKHKDGTPIQQMFWKQDIVQHLKGGEIT